MLSSVNGAVIVPAQGRPLLSRAGVTFVVGVVTLQASGGGGAAPPDGKASSAMAPKMIPQQEAARSAAFVIPDPISQTGACYACRRGGQYRSSKCDRLICA